MGKGKGFLVISSTQERGLNFSILRTYFFSWQNLVEKVTAKQKTPNVRLNEEMIPERRFPKIVDEFDLHFMLISEKK
jgi:hypothetical protein